MSLQIGGYQLHAIEEGRFGLDGGSMFGIIPRPLWSRTNPPDEKNRIDLALRLLLLTSPKRNILIDTGIGKKWSAKEQEIYKISHDRFTIEGSLATVGLTVSDITDVILTHLHFDHAGGATVLRGEELAPTFPQATYHVQAGNLSWGSKPTMRDRGSYLKRDFQPLVDQKRLELIDGPTELFEGVHLEVMEGHTFSQQLVRVTDGKTTVFFCADLFPTTSHIALPYIMGYDLQPLKTLEEKQRILPRALDEGWILFFEHDPETEAATLKLGERGIVVDQGMTLSSPLIKCFLPRASHFGSDQGAGTDSN